MNEFIEDQVAFGWEDLRSSYDVVIVGGGGHGLSTAYHLATRHGITNVAVLERGYIGSGNSGRNTTVIRANYGIPEAVRFYQRSVDLYSRLEEETGRWIMHDRKGLLWLVHGIAGTRNERARSMVNQAFGADTVYVTPDESRRGSVPTIDLDAGGRGVPGDSAAPTVPHGATARHDRVVWALAEGAMQRWASTSTSGPR